MEKKDAPLLKHSPPKKYQHQKKYPAASEVPTSKKSRFHFNKDTFFNKCDTIAVYTNYHSDSSGVVNEKSARNLNIFTTDHAYASFLFTYLKTNSMQLMWKKGLGKSLLS